MSNPSLGTKPKGFKTPGPEHIFDFPSLIIDHQPSSQKVVPLVDVDVTVYGLDEIAGSKLPIGVIILSHGRCNSAKNSEAMASGLLGEIRKLDKNAVGRKKTRDCLVVTVDSRNHGTRTKYRNTNLSFDKNEVHLIDMAATIYGGAQDHVFIIDFLASYLFPRAEREIAEFMAVGFSMGGGTVWRLLREEPSFQIGVPMITIPSEALEENLLERAGQMQVKELIYPPGVQNHLQERPATGAYRNKKILSMHGGLDFLMPVQRCIPIVDRIRADSYPGHVDLYIDPEVGHKVSQNMVKRAAEWCWRWGLTVPTYERPPKANL